MEIISDSDHFCGEIDNQIWIESNKIAGSPILKRVVGKAALKR